MKTDPKVIVAVDYPTIEPVRHLVNQLSPELCRLKIGNILFTRYGPKLVEEFMQAGFEIFLDLKFHDIPQTVANACRSAAAIGAWMVNIHVSGGVKMMTTAKQALHNCKNRPLLIGVTLLTSLDQQDIASIGITQPIEEIVLQMATQAQTAGLDGVVCGSTEAPLLRSHLGDDFILVTPGIRLPGDNNNDQKRVLTPKAAINAGSSYLVIGRSITDSDNPRKTLEGIIQTIDSN